MCELVQMQFSVLQNQIWLLPKSFRDSSATCRIVKCCKLAGPDGWHMRLLFHPVKVLNFNHCLRLTGQALIPTEAFRSSLDVSHLKATQATSGLII